MNADSVLNDPEVVNVLAQVAGANSIDVIGELLEAGELDEFSLSERLGMDVRLVRKILYKLYDQRLVKFKKLKDEETGWYIYLWRFDNDRLKHLVEKVRRERIKKLRKQLEYEKNNQFFVCENGCTRVTFQEAMESGFVCKYCGSRLNFVDNSHIIRQLEEQLKQLERTFGL